MGQANGLEANGKRLLASVASHPLDGFERLRVILVGEQTGCPSTVDDVHLPPMVSEPCPFFPILLVATI